MKKVAAATASAIGAASGAVTIFAWMNITPEMVGRSMYEALRFILPFSTFTLGVVFGAGITCLLAIRRGVLPTSRDEDSPFDTKRVETTYTKVEMTPEAMEKARRDVERKALEMRVHDLEDKG